jgi:hypothetical protein
MTTVTSVLGAFEAWRNLHFESVVHRKADLTRLRGAEIDLVMMAGMSETSRRYSREPAGRSNEACLERPTTDPSFVDINLARLMGPAGAVRSGSATGSGWCRTAAGYSQGKATPKSYAVGLEIRVPAAPMAGPLKSPAPEG